MILDILVRVLFPLAVMIGIVSLAIYLSYHASTQHVSVCDFQRLHFQSPATHTTMVAICQADRTGDQAAQALAAHVIRFVDAQEGE